MGSEGVHAAVLAAAVPGKQQAGRQADTHVVGQTGRQPARMSMKYTQSGFADVILVLCAGHLLV
jgi:hypothetical protein